MEDASQCAECAMLKRFDRSLAAAHYLAHRAVVESFDEFEDDNLALLVCQMLQRDLELAALERALGQYLRVGEGSGERLAQVNLTPAFAAAMEVDQAVAGD